MEEEDFEKAFLDTPSVNVSEGREGGREEGVFQRLHGCSGMILGALILV